MLFPIVRVAKERQMYVKELETEHKRLQTFKDEGRDEHELRQQVCDLTCALCLDHFIDCESLTDASD